MLLCPFCEEPLLEEDAVDGVWNCGCGESVPVGLAVDTSKSKCGQRECR